ncbi:hypothetical protein, partial [Aeromonas hydrophila]|uniref:hypothetical protein n=1 Tax=Aeromonas hydrophila TaxID=644 RepID=UPI001955388E
RCATWLRYTPTESARLTGAEFMEMDPACQQWKFHSGIVRLLCEQSALKVPPIAEKPRMTGP